MTVAHDAATESTFTTTSPATFSHTPVGTPKGVLVTIAHQPGFADTITGVTYGGKTMRRIAFAQDATTEPGAAYMYYLGRDIPTGAQTVSIAHGGTTDTKHAVAITVTGADNTVAYVDAILQGDQANPQSALDLGVLSGLSYCVIFSGHNDIASLALLSGMSAVHDHDYGTKVIRVDRRTTAGSGSFTIGYTATSEDCAMVSCGITDSFGEAFVDTFTEAADTNLQSHTPNTGLSWSRFTTGNGQAIVEESDDTLVSPYYSGAVGHYYTANISAAVGENQRCDGRNTVSSIVALATRLSGGDDGYTFYYDSGANNWTINRWDNDSSTVLATGGAGVTPGTTEFATLTVVGQNPGTLKGFLQGAELVATTDSTYDTGPFGVRCFKSLAAAGMDDYTGYHIPAAAVVTPSPVFITNVPKLPGGVSSFTSLREVAPPERVFPHFDVPRRLPGGVSFWTEFREPPTVIPIPRFDIPRGLPGGESFATFLQLEPEAEAAVVPPPFFDIPKGFLGGSSFFTSLREVALAHRPQPHSDIPKGLGGGKDFVALFTEPPPPAPPVAEFAFALQPPTPRRIAEVHSTWTPSVFTTVGVIPVKAQIRRGIYHRDGLYEAGFDFSVDEPFASVQANDVTLEHTIFTPIPFNIVTPHTPGLVLPLDPWGLVNLAGEKIVIRHSGYYMVTMYYQWENNNVGQRRARVNLFSAAGVALRNVAEDNRPAAFISSAAIASDIQPFQAGDWLVVTASQSSGGPLVLETLFLSIYRISKSKKVFQ